MSDSRLTDREKEIIEKAYTDISFPGAFGGLNRLREYLRQKKKILVTAAEIKSVLKNVPVYQMHVLAATRFRRRRYTVDGAGIQFQADLAEMPRYGDYKYFLLMVDLYSTFVYVVALTNKTSKAVQNALESIITENRLIKFSGLGTDSGGEFTGVRQYLKNRGASLYIRRGRNKAFQAENFIRIFKHALYRYLRYKKTQNWPKALPLVAKQLNNRRQRNLGPYTPSDLNSPLSDPKTRSFMNRKFSQPSVSKKNEKKETFYKPGDTVYISFLKGQFDKGYDTQRGAIYFIDTVDKKDRPYLYRLKEQDGTVLKGLYYANELYPAPDPDSISHEIRRIVDERRDKNGKKEYLVRWMFYPKK